MLITSSDMMLNISSAASAASREIFLRRSCYCIRICLMIWSLKPTREFFTPWNKHHLEEHSGLRLKWRHEGDSEALYSIAALQKTVFQRMNLKMKLKLPECVPALVCSTQTCTRTHDPEVKCFGSERLKSGGAPCCTNINS